MPTGIEAAPGSWRSGQRRLFFRRNQVIPWHAFASAGDFVHALSRILQIFLAVIVVASPLPFGSVQETWSARWMIVIAGLLGFWLVLQIAQGRIRFVYTRLALPVSLLLLFISTTLLPLPSVLVRTASPDAYALQSQASSILGGTGRLSRLSLGPFETQRELLLLTGYAVLFFLGVNVLRHRAGYLLMYVCIAASGTLLGIFGMAQDLWSDGLIYWKFESGSGTPFGPFVNHNHFAGYMELALGLSLGLFAAEAHMFRIRTGGSGFSGQVSWLWRRHGGRVWLPAASSVIIALALSASRSRAGVLSVAAGAVLFGLWRLGSTRAGKTAAGFRAGLGRHMAASFGIMLLAFVIVSMALSPRIYSRWIPALDDSAHYRVETWAATVRMIGDFPVTGAGLGTFGAIFPRYKTGTFHSATTHAESEYLQWAAEAGAIGTILALWIALVFSHRLLSKLRARQDPYMRCLALGGIFSMLVLSIHNAADFNLHIPSNAMTFVSIAAVTLLAAGTHRGEHYDSLLFRTFVIPLPSAAALGVFLGSLVLSGTLAGCSWMRQRSVLEAQRGTAEEAEAGIEALQRAARTSPWDDRLQCLISGRYENRAAAAGLFRFAERRQLLDSARSSIRNALRLRPAEASYWTALGRIEAGLQNPKAAGAAYEQAVHVQPADGPAQRDYGLYLLRQGDIQSGLARLSLARRYSPALSLRQLLELVAGHTGDVASWRKLVRYDPDDWRTFSEFLQSRGLAEESRQARKISEALKNKAEIR
jgi:O-antigen ligase